MFFSRQVCEKLINWVDTKESYIEDGVITCFLRDFNFKTFSTYLLSTQYILGENDFCIHYTNGKRMYFADFIIKNYYLNGKVGQRKLLLDYPFDLAKNMPVNSWDSPTSLLTPRWYSYTTDNKLWEFYGRHARSYHEFRIYTPFGINSTQKVVVYKTVYDCNKMHEKENLLYLASTINQNGSLYFFLDTLNTFTDLMILILTESGYKVEQKEGNIQNIVDSEEVRSEEGIILEITKK